MSLYRSIDSPSALDVKEVEVEKDEERDPSIVLNTPMLGAISPTSRHGQSSTFFGTELENGVLSSYKPPITETRPLYGEIPSISRYFLSYSMYYNSFFAKRLLHIGLFLSFIMFLGTMFYNYYKPSTLILNPSYPSQYGFQLQDPSKVYLFKANACENMVGFSTMIYHGYPITLILTLPGTGWRLFEPFERKIPMDGKGIKRTFVFQILELLSVCILLDCLITMIYFWYMFFNGATFSCSIPMVHIFAYGAACCYIGIFFLLIAFARYREHIKMQLGAFQEKDQTGNVRHRVLSQWNHTNQNSIDSIRNRLYKATRLNDIREMEGILQHVSQLQLKGFPMEYYQDAKIYMGFFGLSKKNPMHVAAYNGNVEALVLLHSHGFDVGTLDKFSRVRISTGDLFWYCAQWFIAKPVTNDEDHAVSIFKTTLVTPLHCAVVTGQVETVKWLIDHGAEVGTVAKSSSRSERIPPIFMAETPHVLQVLLQHGANHLVIPDPGYMNTLTTLQLAYLRGNLAVAQELEEWGCDVALTPFHTAAALNDLITLRKYIRSRTNINCLGEHGYIGMNRRTPLHWAVVNDATDAVQLLLEAGADPNFQDARGRTPLHWAARLNRVQSVYALLAKGALPLVYDRDYMTPIMCAAYGTNVSCELFRALQAAGGNIDEQLPGTGDTALHIAVRQEQLETALAILATGGNLMKMNGQGLRPLDCTTNTELLFKLKQSAGHRDVMISYTHSHMEFALKLRQSLEDSNITTWLDLMDPSGIGGGSVWREEIARGIMNAALMICIITEDYPQSEWCLKELALAKQVGTPIIAVSTEGVCLTDELQVYLYTRQMIPFESAIQAIVSESSHVTYQYHDSLYQIQFRLLLDGVRDEIEKHRHAMLRKNRTQGRNLTNGPSDTILSNHTLEPPTTSYLFISHGDQHPTIVRRLCHTLQEAGIAYIRDQTYGEQSFEKRIHRAKEAILQCTGFIVLVSKQTMQHELVRDQLAFAEDKQCPIFPIVLNDIAIGFDKRYSLAKTSLYHLIQDGYGYEKNMEPLLQALEILMNKTQMD